MRITIIVRKNGYKECELRS